MTNSEEILARLVQLEQEVHHLAERINQPETWTEYRRLVLDQLKQLASQIKAVDEKSDNHQREVLAQMGKVKTDVAMLKTKASIIAASIGSVVGAVISALVAMIVSNN